MRLILIFCLILSTTTSYGKCTKKKKSCCKKTATTATTKKVNTNEVWMQYYETKCDNPWHFNWFVKPTEEQILSAVKGDLLGREINILEMRSTADEQIISCDACTCPNGRQFYARIPKADIYKLKELKFFETQHVPAEKAVIDNSK